MLPLVIPLDAIQVRDGVEGAGRIAIRLKVGALGIDLFTQCGFLIVVPRQIFATSPDDGNGIVG